MILGWFCTDPLEKTFESVHRGSDGTYVVTAQAVVEQVSIQHAKLFLQLGPDFPPKSSHSGGHRCDVCSQRLNDKECEVLDNLQTLEESLREETVSLVHIAGYVQKRGYEVKENDLLSYYQKFGKYFDVLNKGSLTITQDYLVQGILNGPLAPLGGHGVVLRGPQAKAFSR